jgi:hypothetical protein
MFAFSGDIALGMAHADPLNQDFFEKYSDREQRRARI